MYCKECTDISYVKMPMVKTEQVAELLSAPDDTVHSETQMERTVRKNVITPTLYSIYNSVEMCASHAGIK